MNNPTKMNCCTSSSSEHFDARSKAESAAIDKQLNEDRKKELKKIRLLLLGAGDAGKSTFLKQMKIINTKGFSKTELENTNIDSLYTANSHQTRRYKIQLKANVMQNIHVLISETISTSRYGKFPKKLKSIAEELLNADYLTPDLAELVESIWLCSAVQNAWNSRASHFQIHGATPYYMKHVHRIAEDAFVPTDEDVLMCRSKTSGIIESSFEIEGNEFCFVDVGGQRTERRKWIHCFDNVNAIVYLTALDEYDLTLEEDQSTNRMLESLKLFEEVTSSHWLQKIPVILFLNKYDLFKEKLISAPLGKLFSDYKGGDDVQQGVRFIEEEYKTAFGASSPLSIRTTCAIDTENIRYIFESIRTNTIRANLQWQLEHN